MNHKMQAPSSNAADPITLGAAHLRMTNERRTPFLGSSHDDIPEEMPAALMVVLAVACSSSVLIIGLAIRLFGI